MLRIPIVDTFAQTLNVTLNNQFCRLDVYQKTTGLFIDVYVDDKLVTGGRICRDRDRIIRGDYLPFDGSLIFADLQGADDPSSPGLGSRFLLFYLEDGELPELT